MDYLCNLGKDIDRLHKNTLSTLCWLGFGSIRELLEWPITLLNRYSRMMEEEGMVEKYWSFKEKAGIR